MYHVHTQTVATFVLLPTQRQNGLVRVAPNCTNIGEKNSKNSHNYKCFEASGATVQMPLKLHHPPVAIVNHSSGCGCEGLGVFQRDLWLRWGCWLGLSQGRTVWDVLIVPRDCHQSCRPVSHWSKPWLHLQRGSSITWMRTCPNDQCLRCALQHGHIMDTMWTRHGHNLDRTLTGHGHNMDKTWRLCIVLSLLY